MLTKVELLQLDKHKVAILKGIYFLFTNEEIIYIGMSINIIGRIASHLLDKEFDYFTYIIVDKLSERRELEQAYIRHFKPKYNKIIVTEQIYLPAHIKLPYKQPNYRKA